MSDDFVKVFGDKVPVHQPKSVAEELRSEAIEWEARKRADPKLVAAAYDDINDAMTVQHQAAPTSLPDAAERERIVREERAFLEAFSRGLSDKLRQVDMRVTNVAVDGKGTGWRIAVKDRENRPFDVTITYEDAVLAGQRYGSGMGERLMSQVMTRLIDARRLYFARMH